MKQHSTKILVAILAVLIAGFVLTKVFRSPARESNVDGRALRLDTARISEIALRTRNNDVEVRLLRQAEGWKAAKPDVSVDADPYAVKSVLRTLAGLKSERIVTRNEDKWNDYGVGDSVTVTIKAYDAGNEIADYIIGNERSGKTYIRQAKKSEVFAVDGMIRTAFNKDFDDFRNRAFLRVEPERVVRVTFNYPSDSGFVVSRKDGAWMLGESLADSASVESYLHSLRTKNLSSFADEFSPAGDPDISIVLESDSTVLENIRAWHQPDSTWRLTSDLRGDVYFSDAGSTIARDLFKSRKSFE